MYQMTPWQGQPNIPQEAYDIMWNQKIRMLMAPEKHERTMDEVKADRNTNQLYYEYEVKINDGLQKRRYKRILCVGIPIDYEIHLYKSRYGNEDYIRIKWLTPSGDTEDVDIPPDIMGTSQMLRTFVQKGVVQLADGKNLNDKAIKICSYILSINKDPKVITHNDENGWVLNNESRLEFHYGQIRRDDSASDYEVLCETANLMKIFKDAAFGYIMILIAVFGLLNRWFIAIGAPFRKIVQVIGDSVDKEFIASLFWNTSGGITAMDNSRRIKECLFSHSDDVIIMSESSRCDTYEQQAKSCLVDAVCRNGNYFYDDCVYNVVSLVAVCAERFLYEYPPSSFLIVPIDSDDINDSNAPTSYRSYMPDFIYRLAKYITGKGIDVESIYSECYPKTYGPLGLKKVCAQLKSCAVITDKYAVSICGRTLLELTGIQKDAGSIIKDFIAFNEEYQDLSHTGDAFVSRIERYIKTNSCVIFDNVQRKFRSAVEDGKMIIYLGRKTVYISMKDIKEMVFPNE